MKKKTEQEKIWNYLVKKLGATRKAKQIFNRVTKTEKERTNHVHIKYHIDTGPLLQSVGLAKKLVSSLRKIKIAK